MRRSENNVDSLLKSLTGKVIGQDHAMRAIAPYIRLHEAGLGPEGRPAGVFLLLGPTGTGKTRTVEALAEALHGSRRNMLRIDCGEYQMDHEVAKLIGAPPGYLGHRETNPLLTQARLASVASSNSSLSLLLFDEVEKAAPSLTRLMLGILDKATLRLGDNNLVNFERCLIFMTSNIGAQRMQQELTPGIGFAASGAPVAADRLDAVALRAARRNFSPEFMNRIDAAITYKPLSSKALEEILLLHLQEFQDHIHNRLGLKSFRVETTPALRRFLLEKGSSTEYGAREIRRVIHRYVAQRVANLVLAGKTRPGSVVKLDVLQGDEETRLRAA